MQVTPELIAAVQQVMADTAVATTTPATTVAPATPAAPTAPAVRNTDGGAVATWQTPSGRARAAHTLAGLRSAPAKIQDKIADETTLAALDKGLYNGFYRDALAAMTQGHQKALAARLNAHFKDANITVPQLGSVVQLAFNELGGLRPNKTMFRIIAEHVAAPTAVIKGVEQPKAFPKSKQRFSRIAAAWLAGQ